MVMALAGNKADLLDARKIAAEASSSFPAIVTTYKFAIYIYMGPLSHDKYSCLLSRI